MDRDVPAARNSFVIAVMMRNRNQSLPLPQLRLAPGLVRQPGWLVIVYLFGLCSGFADLAASASAMGTVQPQDCAATIGFQGQFKLGRWSPIFFSGPEVDNATHFRVTVPDGNGRRIIYSGPILSSQIQPQGWLKIGRSFGTADIELLGSNDQIVACTNLEIGKAGAEALDPTLPLILTIESSAVLQQAVKQLENQLFKSASNVVSIHDAKSLPVCPSAYDGVQVIYLSTADATLLDSLSVPQLDAIEKWVFRGGKLFFSAGSNADQAFTRPDGLSRFLPGKFDSQFDLESSRQIERYTVSKQPLLVRGDAPLKATRLSEITGIAEPSGARQPTVIRQPFGFGQVVFATVDVDLAPVAQWSGLKNLLLKGTVQNINLNRSGYSENESRGVVQIGYRDLVGQLMLPLEQFTKVRFVNFTIVAVLIGLFVLCVGPGDYFLLKKLFGKMEWTWLTFTLLTLLFCGLAYWIAKTTRPAEMQINQLEIIDVDTQTKAVRGSIWTNIFSPQVARASIDTDTRNAIGISTQGSSCWLGLPGQGLSGMQSRAASDTSSLPYACQLDFLETGSGTAALVDLPLQVSSTKTIFTRYHSQVDFQTRSRLRVNPNRSERLVGSITNPLNVEIRNCRLLYQNWVHLFPTAIAPGETVDIYSGTRERTTTYYFSRQQDTASDKEGGLAWNPQDADIDRIAEMLMFHEAARGRDYTSMSNGYQAEIDLSEQVNLNRAILFGQLGDVCTQLNFESNAGTPEYDNCRTILRLILPVDVSNSN